MKINPTTGMPELPEGFRWEVGMQSKSSGGYKVTIQRQTEVTKTKYKKNFFGFERGYVATEMVWEDQNSLMITVPMLDSEGNPRFDGPAEHKRPRYEYVRVLTPKTILETATKVYDVWYRDYAQEVAQREAEERYLGTYPPNSL